MMGSCREALQKLLAAIDRLEESPCTMCLHPSDLTNECKVHDRAWQKTIADARKALAESNN